MYGHHKLARASEVCRGRKEGCPRTPLHGLTKDANFLAFFLSNPSGQGRDFKRMGGLKWKWG